MKESYLLLSPLEYTNEPYAVAKIAGIKMCESFNIQYKTNFISVMPTNLYGPGDNFDLEKSHVLPALLRKIHLAKCIENNNWELIRKDLNNNPIERIHGSYEKNTILNILSKYGIEILKKDNTTVKINLWGTGTPLREFMYSLDMADACVFLMENVDVNQITELNRKETDSNSHPSQFINIGTGEEISIHDLAMKIKTLIGFRGIIEFDKTKPDGTLRKTIDISLLQKLGFRHKYNLDAGLPLYYSDYLRKIETQML